MSESESESERLLQEFFRDSAKKLIAAGYEITNPEHELKVEFVKNEEDGTTEVIFSW